MVNMPGNRVSRLVQKIDTTQRIGVKSYAIYEQRLAEITQFQYL